MERGKEVFSFLHLDILIIIFLISFFPSQTLSKLLNAVFHMIRILIKKGLNLEDYFRSMDVEKKGLIHKKQMLFTLKQLGLPFSLKELQDITHNYCQPASEKVDYISFLREGRLGKKNNNSLSNNNSVDDILDIQKINNSHNPNDLTSYTLVLHDVKRMLLESIRTLNKNYDDVYRMFARWDTLGSGTVTATQFLRVLARLHIELSDQDQDYLIELLDTNAMGRIDFESLLSYCFNFEEVTSPHGIVGGVIGFDENAGETLSAVSIDAQSVEQKSITSGNILKRPQTASISRPYNNNSPSFPTNNTNNNNNQNRNSNNSNNVSGRNQQFHSNYQKPVTGDRAADLDTSFRNNNNDHYHSNNPVEERKKSEKVRPSTAVARVSSSSSSSTQQQKNQYQTHQFLRKQPSEIEEEDGVLDLPDDVINGEEMYLSSNNNNYNGREENVPRQVKYNQFFTQAEEEHNEDGNNYDLPEPSPCKEESFFFFSLFISNLFF
jgi:Ca2+-binding EF-hand superfamily protein